MKSVNSLYDFDQDGYAQLLIEAGIDIRTRDATIRSADVNIDIDVDGDMEYVITTRLNATESAQFNKVINDLL